MKGRCKLKRGQEISLFDYVFEQMTYGGHGEKADKELMLSRVVLGYSQLIDFLADKGIVQQGDLQRILPVWNTFEMEKES